MVKRIAVFSVVAILIFILIVAVSSALCGSNYGSPDNNPHDVAYAAVEALGSMDPDIVCQYFAGEAYHLMRSGLVDFYARYSEVDTSGIFVTIINEGQGQATALIDYDLTYGIYGWTDTKHISKRVRMINQQGQWYLSGKI